MPDFSQLLKKPAGEAKRPPALPAGTYPGIVSGQEQGDSNRNKTPYVRFQVRLTGPADDVSQDELADIDLAKRQMRRDYYLTDDALWRLDEFIKSCGIPTEGRTYEEVLPEVIGQTVLVSVEQYLGTNNEIGNQIGRLVGEAG